MSERLDLLLDRLESFDISVSKHALFLGRNGGVAATRSRLLERLLPTNPCHWATDLWERKVSDMLCYRLKGEHGAGEVACFEFELKNNKIVAFGFTV